MRCDWLCVFSCTQVTVHVQEEILDLQVHNFPEYVVVGADVEFDVTISQGQFNGLLKDTLFLYDKVPIYGHATGSDVTVQLLTNHSAHSGYSWSLASTQHGSYVLSEPGIYTLTLTAYNDVR